MAAIEGGADISRQFTVYLKNVGKSGKEERDCGCTEYSLGTRIK
jgi:hypothetical protein